MTKLLPLLLIMVSLAGCSTAPKTTNLPNSAWDTHKLAVDKVTNWSADGKIGVRIGDQYNPASFNWRQTFNDYAISFKGPLGQGSVGITGNQYSATLDIPGEPLLEASSPEELLALRLGWQMPIRDVQYWIRGIPSPRSPFDATFSEQKLAALKQQGWKIEYSKYIESENLSLPGKVVMSREDLKLTVIVKKWRTNRQ